MYNITNESALELLENTGHTKPGLESWGIASKDFSSGGFWWFDNQTTLHQFLQEGLPALEIYPEETEDFEQQYNEYLTVLNGIDWNAPEFKELMKFRDNYFGVDIEIIWIGPLKELSSGSTPFANFIREEFSESQEPISDHSIEDFRKFLDEEIPNVGLFDLD